MSMEILLTRALLDVEGRDLIKASGVFGALSPGGQALFKVVDKYYTQTATSKVAIPEFMTWLCTVHSANANASIHEAVRARITAASTHPFPNNLVSQIREAAQRRALNEALEKYDGGDEVALSDLLHAVMRKYPQTDCGFEQALRPIEDIIQDADADVGFHFRLDALNKGIKPLTGGDFIIVAAAVDSGKTTFCASEITHMAAQVDKLYPGEQRSILWLNNEGAEDAIVHRVFQATLAESSEGLARLHKEGTLKEKYREGLGGRAGVLRIFPIQGATTSALEKLFSIHKPAVIVFDMLDNVAHRTTTEQSKADSKEAIYQWARGVGVKYNCVIVATSQISIDGVKTQAGAPILYPEKEYLKDSRVGKQGAADVIIMIGRHSDPAFDAIRYIGTPKNKRKRTGVSGNIRAEVGFDSDRARFFDL